MRSKTIALDEEAYALLKSHKKRDESFSDLVKRHFRSPPGLSEPAVAWGDLSSKERAELGRARNLGKAADLGRAEHVRDMVGD
jgi:predicted CopG family antitoxin